MQTGVSLQSVQRICAAHILQLHCVLALQALTDSLFVDHVRDIVGLYLNTPDHAIVLCVDEKLPRLSGPTLLVDPERNGLKGLDRTELGSLFERNNIGPLTRDYLFNGVTNLFTAFEVLEGTLLGRCVRRHRHREFLFFLNMIDRAVAAGTVIHVILNNHESHKHPKVLHWLARHPHVSFHFMPDSGSWLRNVETFISAKTRRRFKRGNSQPMVDLETAINCHIDEHNGAPKQFIWIRAPLQIPAKLNSVDASALPNIIENKEITMGSKIRRGWWAGLLSMIVALGALIGSASRESLPANPVLFAQPEVGLKSVPDEASVRARDLLNEAAAEVRAPLTRSLLKELIAQQMVNVQLSADLEISDSHDDLLHRETQSTDTTATRAEIPSCTVRQAPMMKRAGAPACRQEAGTDGQLRERHHQFPDARPEAEDPRLRMDAADARLAHKRAENNGQVTEAAALETNSATLIAPGNLAAIEAQSRAFQAAPRDISLERPEPSSGLPSFTSADAPPVLPTPKPWLRGAISSIGSDTVNYGAPASAGKIAVVEDDIPIPTSSPEVAVSHSEPMTSATPNSLEIRDRRSLATLPMAPVMSTAVARDESSATNKSAGLLKDGYRWGLHEAAARLAQGLRVTREEAISQQQERAFTVDVENRAFISASTTELAPLDPALNMHLLTAKSEIVGKSRGRIRFFADGSSTGGRIELELLGERTTINVRWATGAVTVDR